jgi:hypothetical protein
MGLVKELEVHFRRVLLWTWGFWVLFILWFAVVPLVVKFFIVSTEKKALVIHNLCGTSAARV